LNFLKKKKDLIDNYEESLKKEFYQIEAIILTINIEGFDLEKDIVNTKAVDN